MAKATGHSVGLEVCRVLGLDPDKTRSIDIHFDSESVVVSTVQFYVEAHEVQKILRVLEGVSWKEREGVSDLGQA